MTVNESGGDFDSGGDDMRSRWGRESGAATAAVAGALVAVRGVTKTYRRGPEEVHALRGVSFSVAPGQVVGLVGPSGSGKTTLLNILCGWEQPDEGEVVWVDDPNPVPAEERPWSDIAILPQDLGLLEELSVRENVELPLRLAGRRDDSGAERAEHLLTELGVARYGDRAPGEISLGEQQRVGLARSLVLRPRLLLADEPTGHQDAGWAGVVYESFRGAANEGVCCLVATHSQEFLKLADRVLAIRDGEVHETARP